MFMQFSPHIHALNPPVYSEVHVLQMQFSNSKKMSKKHCVKMLHHMLAINLKALLERLLYRCELTVNFVIS